MNIKRTLLADIERCYTIGSVIIDDEESIIFGSDGQNSDGIRFYGNDFEKSEIVWKELGGCMSIKQIPNRENEILVLQEFYLGESPSKAKVVWYKYSNGTWFAKDLIHLPFTHRMDVLSYNNKLFVLLATVSDFKVNKEDWTIPGSVYAFELTSNFEDHSCVSTKKILGDLHYNHGYFRDDNDIFVSGKEGVFHLKIDSKNIEDWSFNHIYDKPVSDLVFQDLDNDGIEELIVINEFHGNEISVLKYSDKQLKEVFSYSEGCEIIHGLSKIKYKNNKCVVVGVRKGLGQLFLLNYKNDSYHMDVIDEGRGPINVATINKGNKELIAVANHTTHTAMLYEID